MKCLLCGGGEFSHSLPADMYQKSIENNVERYWHHCDKCGLWYQENNLTDKDLDNIYKRYRDTSMRGKTVKDEFKRILDIPDSENIQRVNRILKDTNLGLSKYVLDIGSGLGVFPYQISNYVNKVYSIEPNKDSCEFIKSLDIPCHNGPYLPGVFGREFDLISIIHVLEHIRNPIPFLRSVKKDLDEFGSIYIEVPDSCEFSYLEPTHDEFNSTHFYMFDVATLDIICRKAGLIPYLIRRVKYTGRNLSRITLLAKGANEVT